ncbi:MAG: hypothetical protein ACXWZ4_06185, partial [Gemmatirosa sp.]
DAASAEDSAAQADSAAASAEPAPAAVAAPAQSNADAPLTVADIDRWQRGMEAELKAVRDAGEQLRTAKTGNDTVTAIFAANETSTRAAGASAAGVDESRYGDIRSVLSSIVVNMAPLEAEMDVSKMPAPMLATMKQSREQQLAQIVPQHPPELIEALRARAADLRRQEMTLVGERLKAAGMAR